MGIKHCRFCLWFWEKFFKHGILMNPFKSLKEFGSQITQFVKPKGGDMELGFKFFWEKAPHKKQFHNLSSQQNDIFSPSSWIHRIFC